MRATSPRKNETWKNETWKNETWSSGNAERERIQHERRRAGPRREDHVSAAATWLPELVRQERQPAHHVGACQRYQGKTGGRSVHGRGLRSGPAMCRQDTAIGSKPARHSEWTEGDQGARLREFGAGFHRAASGHQR